MQTSTKARQAVQTLDLVVFVPIEAPDRITFPATDDEGSTRAAVNEKLREILIDDAWELDLEVIEVTGDLETRAETVLQRVRRSEGQLRNR